MYDIHTGTKADPPTFAPSVELHLQFLAVNIFILSKANTSPLHSVSTGMWAVLQCDESSKNRLFIRQGIKRRTLDEHTLFHQPNRHAVRPVHGDLVALNVTDIAQVGCGGGR